MATQEELESQFRELWEEADMTGTPLRKRSILILEMLLNLQAQVVALKASQVTISMGKLGKPVVMIYDPPPPTYYVPQEPK